MDTRELAEFLERLRVRLSLPGGASVVLVSDAAMRRLNRRFAGKDHPTDVLSFPAGSSEGGLGSYLGDIFISVETADRQRAGPLGRELRTLALHGVLHLLGYDHETDQGQMEAVEAGLRKEMRLS